MEELRIRKAGQLGGGGALFSQLTAAVEKKLSLCCSDGPDGPDPLSRGGGGGLEEFVSRMRCRLQPQMLFTADWMQLGLVPGHGCDGGWIR